MKALYATRFITALPNFISTTYSNRYPRAPNFLVPWKPILQTHIDVRFSHTALKSQSPSNPETHEQEMDEEDDPDSQVEDMAVPEHYLVPSKALQESEWLRVTLHKWLDDEYCPEPTNVEISEIAAQSYYKALLERQTDLGEILLKMAMELESISYQESFHGAFSSANAAVNLIAQRIEQA